MLDIVTRLKKTLAVGDEDLDACLSLLKHIGSLNLTPLQLKATPEIIATLKKVCWDCSEIDPLCTCKICLICLYNLDQSS